MTKWGHHQLLVLSKLQDLGETTKAILAKQHEHDKEIDRLKIKSGFFGIIGGVLTAIGIKFGEQFINH